MNIFRQITANNINLEPYPFTKELAMEAYIMENESVLKLDHKNFSNPIVLDAEIPLINGEKNRNGRIDILTKYQNNDGTYYAIVELKLDEINNKTLDQLLGYLKERHQLIDNVDQDKNLKWIGILVGKTISQELQNTIETDGCIRYKDENIDTEIEITIAAITINRYRGERHGEIFVVTDTYYKDPNTRDFSKYDFKYKDEKINTKPLSKGALVTEVIRHYVRQNPQIKIDELKQIFHKDLQGTLECLDEINVATKIKADHKGRSYHRFGSSNEIKLSDATIVTSNGWALENIQWFIKGAEKLGYNIENSLLK